MTQKRQIAAFSRSFSASRLRFFSYRKTLINVFVNAIFLYDDKITIIFNSGDKPVTIDDELLSDIEESNAAVEGSLLDAVAPPQGY